MGPETYYPTRPTYAHNRILLPHAKKLLSSYHCPRGGRATAATIVINKKTLATLIVLPSIPADAKRINIKSTNEVNYWCRTFNCTETRLRNAVLAVGSLSADVQQYLNR